MHRHHRKRRSQGGTDDETNIMLVTPEQHTWIHDNPEKAYELGWLVKSWQDPATVPVLSFDDDVEGDDGLKPGSTCPTCERRIPHPRKRKSPESVVFSYRVPLDEAEAHREVLEETARFLHSFERPHWQFWTLTIALATVLQDEGLRGAGQRSEVAS